MMRLAMRTGQPFRDLVAWWDPRDVDTAYQILLDEQEQAEEQAAIERLQQKAQALAQRMAGG
jgi:hypothetical protein